MDGTRGADGTDASEAKHITLQLSGTVEQLIVKFPQSGKSVTISLASLSDDLLLVDAKGGDGGDGGNGGMKMSFRF